MVWRYSHRCLNSNSYAHLMGVNNQSANQFQTEENPDTKSLRVIPTIIIHKTRQPANRLPSGCGQERRCPKEGRTQQTTLPQETQRYCKSHEKPSIIIPKTRQQTNNKPWGCDQERRYAHYRKRPRRARHYYSKNTTTNK